MKTTSLWHSLYCGFVGLRDMLQSGRNAKIHVGVTLFVIATGLCLPLSRTDWAVMTLTIGAVFAAEAVNTAIEHVVDLEVFDRRFQDCPARRIGSALPDQSF